MPKVLKSGIYVISILIVIAALFLTGCPAPSDTEPDQPDTTPDSVDDTANGETSDDGSLSAGGDDGVAGRGSMPGGETVTTGDLDGIIENFGVFVYPEAVLMEEVSMVQRFREGSEIYQLGFNTTSTVETVLEWFKENIEPEAELGEMVMPTGSIVYNYNYRSPDNRLTKSITITGFTGEARCQISVNMTRAFDPVSEPDASD